jgi:hypothetical protein
VLRKGAFKMGAIHSVCPIRYSDEKMKAVGDTEKLLNMCADNINLINIYTTYIFADIVMMSGHQRDEVRASAVYINSLCGHVDHMIDSINDMHGYEDLHILYGRSPSAINMYTLMVDGLLEGRHNLDGTTAIKILDNEKSYRLIKDAHS